MATQAELTEGQLCPDCKQANIVRNPKTGKLFCEDKCWTKGQQAPAPVQAQAPQSEKMTKEDWSQKDAQIAKQAIAKSIIEQGKSYIDGIQDAEAWLKWILRKESTPF